MLLLLSLGSAAFAQMPGITLGLPTGELRWVTQEVEARRFPASAATQAPGPSLRIGDEVELIVVEGTLARVKKGDRYGWVPASALTEEAPASANLPDLGGGLLGQPLLAPPPGAGAAP